MGEIGHQARVNAMKIPQRAETNLPPPASSRREGPRQSMEEKESAMGRINEGGVVCDAKSELRPSMTLIAFQTNLWPLNAAVEAATRFSWRDMAKALPWWPKKYAKLSSRSKPPKKRPNSSTAVFNEKLPKGSWFPSKPWRILPKLVITSRKPAPWWATLPPRQPRTGGIDIAD